MKGVVLYDMNDKKIFVSRDVTHHDHILPYHNSTNSIPWTYHTTPIHKSHIEPTIDDDPVHIPHPHSPPSDLDPLPHDNEPASEPDIDPVPASPNESSNNSPLNLPMNLHPHKQMNQFLTLEDPPEFLIHLHTLQITYAIFQPAHQNQHLQVYSIPYLTTILMLISLNPLVDLPCLLSLLLNLEIIRKLSNISAG
jgi:hypothetical protein